ncbi:MAG: hypothetical protein FWD45_04480 [Coriobacteriia bacterium]|nr:hypothetical protein [Coriobacteriia bacterium]
MAKSLPVDLKKAIALISGINQETSVQLHLELFVDQSLTPAFRAAAQQAFRPQSTNLTVSLTAFTDSAENDFPVFSSEADLIVILANRSDFCAELYLAALRQTDVVIVTENTLNFVNAWPANLSIDSDRLIAVTDEILTRDGFGVLFANLAKWLSDAQPDNRLAWARALSFINELQFKEIVSSTAMQNGVIATAFFMPGADLPVLLINQMRMFFRLAAIQGVEFKGQPYAELVALTASAFIWRDLARRLVEAMPAVSWAVKGTVGYVGTLALGRLAKLYLSALYQRQLDQGGQLDDSGAAGEVNGRATEGTAATAGATTAEGLLASEAAALVVAAAQKAAAAATASTTPTVSETNEESPIKRRLIEADII